MINIENLSVKLGTREIFNKYSFSLKQGDVMSIIGPNGRGKTTLLRSLLGLINSESNKMDIEGHIGYVPQMSSLVFSYPVIDVVLMGRARFIGTFSSPSKKDYKIAEEYLDMTGSLSFRDRLINTLSGGEKQLVMISRALVSECDILILDEPCSALDFRNQNIILNIIKKISKKNNTTVIFTTHIPHHASHVSSHGLLMYSENQYKFGMCEEVMTENNLTKLYSLPIQPLKSENSGEVVMTPKFS